MSKISVITATNLKPERIGWLIDLNHSLQSQNIEHIVVIDGDTPAPSDLNGLIIPLGRNYGQAIARNLALEYVQSEYVTSADDDDRVPLDGLYARMRALDANPEYGWVGGKMSNLSTSGEHQNYWECLANVGVYNPGEVFARWAEPGDGFLLVQCDSV